MEIYNEIKKDISIIAAIYIIALLFQSIFNLGLDDTDNPNGDRSGLKLYTDYGTGIQYLSTRNGQLIPRLSSDGKSVMTITSDTENTR